MVSALIWTALLPSSLKSALTASRILNMPLISLEISRIFLRKSARSDWKGLVDRCLFWHWYIQGPTKKKLHYINKISLQNPKSKSLDEGTDKESDVSEKSSKETPKRSQSVTESLLKGPDSSSESSPNKKKVNIYHEIIRSTFYMNGIDHRNTISCILYRKLYLNRLPKIFPPNNHNRISSIPKKGLKVNHQQSKLIHLVHLAVNPSVIWVSPMLLSSGV